jgi:hypothetical protein
MSEKKDFNPETDIVFTIVQKLSGKKVNETHVEKQDVLEPLPVVEIPSGAPPSMPMQPHKKLVYFDFASNSFSTFVASDPRLASSDVVKDLGVLTKTLKALGDCYLVLNVDANIKAIEQLVPQISQKFLIVKIILVASSSNMDFCQSLKKSYPSITHLLLFPLSVEKIKNL